MSLWRRSLAEFFGTFWLVFGGCGAAVIAATGPAEAIGSTAQVAGGPLGGAVLHAIASGAPTFSFARLAIGLALAFVHLIFEPRVVQPAEGERVPRGAQAGEARVR
jgi:aquaporin Z